MFSIDNRGHSPGLVVGKGATVTTVLEERHLASQSSLVSKLLPLPSQPPYQNLIHDLVVELWNHFTLKERHLPSLLGNWQTSIATPQVQVALHASSVSNRLVLPRQPPYQNLWHRLSL